MTITKEVFDRYEKVRKSGILNMFDVKNVCLFADISKEEVIEIMKNYSSLKEKFHPSS